MKEMRIFLKIIVHYYTPFTNLHILTNTYKFLHILTYSPFISTQNIFLQILTFFVYSHTCYTCLHILKYSDISLHFTCIYFLVHSTQFYILFHILTILHILNYNPCSRDDNLHILTISYIYH